MIRVHLSPDIGPQPWNFPSATDWEITADQTLQVFDAPDRVVAEFAVGKWIIVERIDGGAV